MRLLHTADWHLGQTLHMQSREHEHALFLDWLHGQLLEHDIDVMILAGDVFDGQNPPVTAQAALYCFLARARQARPGLTVVMVAGNHDSGGRLEAPSPLLEALGVHVIGSVNHGTDGSPDLEHLIVPLPAPDGGIAGWCVAMPYLRQGDLKADDLIEGVRALYAYAIDGARARCQPNQALVAIGHCYMAGGQLSELSERKVLCGNLNALPVDLFPAELDYVALGHLHRAQAVGGREAVRYSGSPLPLSLDEDKYPHQVVLVELIDGRLAGLKPLLVPRFVEIIRLPVVDLDGLPAQLAELPDAEHRNGLESWPFLEVRVRLTQPEPGLQAKIDEWLKNKAVRRLKTTFIQGGDGLSLADSVRAVPLATLSPEEVFRRCWMKSNEAEPRPEHMAAFHDLLEVALRGNP
ncbi:MAG: exonuclease SbcCD subunit D C-terminal domain-containing protein [Rhodospirillaceae bacterium]